MKSAPLVQRILAGIHPSQRLCIVGHIRPDGDCVGSQLGLALALRAAGKTVTCWNADPLPPKLAFLDPEQLWQPPCPGQSFDCVIATDAANLDRLGPVSPCVQDRKLFINIDHHASNSQYADLNWVRSDLPSTGELIFQLLQAAAWPITPAIADCLFTAISTDTGSFQYPSTRPETFAAAGELVKLGAHLARISQRVYESQSLSRVQLLRELYRRFRLVHDGQIAYFVLRQADFARTGATPDEAEGLIDYLRAIQSVVVACIFEEVEPALTRISLRSKNPRLNVNDVAAQFGGGGHPAAAGARIPRNTAVVQRQVIRAIEQALDSSAEPHGSL